MFFNSYSLRVPVINAYLCVLSCDFCTLTDNQNTSRGRITPRRLTCQGSVENILYFRSGCVLETQTLLFISAKASWVNAQNKLLRVIVQAGMLKLLF